MTKGVLEFSNDCEYMKIMCVKYADKDVNMKAIFAVMNTTCAVVKIRPRKKKKKFRPVIN